MEAQNLYFGGVRRFKLLKKNQNVCMLKLWQPKLMLTKNHISIQKKNDVLKLFQYISLTAIERNSYDTELSKLCFAKANVLFVKEETETVPVISQRSRGYPLKEYSGFQLKKRVAI